MQQNFSFQRLEKKGSDEKPTRCAQCILSTIGLALTWAALVALRACVCPSTYTTTGQLDSVALGQLNFGRKEKFNERLYDSAHEEFSLSLSVITMRNKLLGTVSACLCVFVCVYLKCTRILSSGGFLSMPGSVVVLRHSDEQAKKGSTGPTHSRQTLQMASRVSLGPERQLVPVLSDALGLISELC